MSQYHEALAKKISDLYHSKDMSKDELISQSSTIKEAIDLLDRGQIRVAEKIDGSWVTHSWVKEAVLLYFKTQQMEDYSVGPFSYRDKIPLKSNYAELNVRVVPPATARYGCFFEPGVILMPSYVNIGAYVGANTMVDTWATVGSCAQIGSDVHLSGGVGIGGVLEPAGARPVVIEDGAFIGSRAIVVEGAVIEEKAVLAANTTNRTIAAQSAGNKRRSPNTIASPSTDSSSTIPIAP